MNSQINNRLLRTVLLLSAAIWLWQLDGVAARTQEVRYTLEVGFGNVVPRGGRLVPVSVTIDNPVTTADGLFELSQPDRLGSHTITQQMQITVPAPSKRRYTMLSRLHPGRNVRVRIRYDNVLTDFTAEQPVRAADRALVLCVGLSDACLRRAGRPGYRFAALEPGDLLSDPRGYEAVHAIVMGTAQVADLQTLQTRALLKWAECGGRLILVGRPQDLGTRSDAEALLTVLRSRESGQTVVAFGAGVLASDPTTDPIVPIWNRDAEVGRRLFPETPLEARALESFHSGSGVFSRILQRLDAGSQRSQWAVLWLGFFLSCYVLAVGPIDHWIVRRTRRPLLTWVTFPGTIVLFSLLAAGFSSTTQRQLVQAMQLNVADVGVEAGTARVNSIGWLYSPQHASYTLQCREPNVTLTARETVFVTGAAAAIRITHGRLDSMEARVPAYSTKCFDATRYMDWDHKVSWSRDEEGWNFDIAPDLDVESAYVANEHGLSPCRLDTKTRTWRSLPMRWSWLHFFRHTPEGLTARGKLSLESRAFTNSVKRYLVWASFVHPLTPAEIEEVQRQRRAVTEWYSTLHYAPRATPAELLPRGGEADIGVPPDFHSRDGREQALNISAHVRGDGHVLVLFLGPQSDLVPIAFQEHRLHSLRMEVVRVRLPSGPTTVPEPTDRGKEPERP